MDDATYNKQGTIPDEETQPPVPEEVAGDSVCPEQAVDGENDGQSPCEPHQPSEDRDIVSRFTVELFDWIQTIVSSLILVSLVFAFLARIIGVSGPSMQDTLHTDEKVLISHLFYTPKCGDVVVFTKKDIHKVLSIGNEDEPLVKRIIAVAGQTVDVNYFKGEVRVDGELLDEPYIKEPATQEGTTKLQFPYTVPDGTVFVMGDNRNSSSDSRMFGPVDTRYILGRVLLRVWPLSGFGPLDSGSGDS